MPGNPSSLKNGLAKIDGCPGHLARRRASRFCPGMTSVDISTPTHVYDLAARCARGVDESSAQRGRGECRMPVAPAASCALGIGRTHTSNNEYTGITRHSRTQGRDGYDRPGTSLRHCERKRSNPESGEARLDCFVAYAPRNDDCVAIGKALAKIVPVSRDAA